MVQFGLIAAGRFFVSQFDPWSSGVMRIVPLWVALACLVCLSCGCRSELPPVTSPEFEAEMARDPMAIDMNK
ncbi:MAG: hypothetical protein EA381_07870 [Planctomycetaceae bacterium]|nr:MAG: hypothetical protein EA381_07870 [Planctomycetaceae bacterium]